MKRKTFKHVLFTGERSLERSNAVYCIAKAAPDSNWAECQPIELIHSDRLYVQAGVEFWGWL